MAASSDPEPKLVVSPNRIQDAGRLAAASSEILVPGHIEAGIGDLQIYKRWNQFASLNLYAPHPMRASSDGERSASDINIIVARAPSKAVSNQK